MLLYTEEMQAQQRAENGVREVILGYYGHPETWIESSQGTQTVSEIVGDFDGGPIKQVGVADLPPEVLEVYLAEEHRRKTGQILKSTDFKTIEGR
ncbi:MAG: hypothetical protein ACREQ5_07235 [Candidatus Dormibacteria bacterium]